MRALAHDGFEIGNHTVGHGGGLDDYLSMEDQLLANGVPKPTTVAWPLYQVATSICADLAANGYTFGRGGHFRAYRPTVDNPFDVPSMWCSTVEQFIACVRQATGGRIVVITFHGVPDMEHPSVGIEPETFKAMMQYLKDNNYKGIALRDLAEYIDPAKASKLPPTVNDLKESGSAMLVKEDKPYVAVAAKDRSTKVSAVTVSKTAVSTAKDMLTFVLPKPAAVAISGTSIGVYVPTSTDVTALAPTFTLSPSTTAVPASGTARDFTTPQTYTITAQDGSSQVYTVTVIKSTRPNAFTWGKAEDGNWSDGSKWSNQLTDGSAPVATGSPDYVLNFNLPGKHAVTNDLHDGFQLNQFNIDESRGLKLAGKSISLVTNSATGIPPQINVNTSSERDHISIPINLAADVTVNVKLRGRLFLKGLISGSGSLTLNCPGATGDRFDNWGILRIENKINTYSGGTIINSGQCFLLYAEQGRGTGSVTLNEGADIRLECHAMTNPLILNGGTIEGGAWDAPITLNGIAKLAGSMSLNETSGGMSGLGGFTQIGPIGPFSRVNAGEIRLSGINTYTGPTTVHQGTLIIKKAVSLYNADPIRWTASKISVHPAATLVITAGGPGEFTGAHIDTLLTNLTASVHDNGLIARLTFCVDTAKATGPVAVSADITDSKGPGGGAFILKKCGAGTLQLSGNSTYTGQTVLEGGELSVASLSSVVNGKASSSLGAPTDVESGEIVIGSGDGEFALIYTGAGETSDRVMNLAGKTSTAENPGKRAPCLAGRIPLCSGPGRRRMSRRSRR